MAGPVATIWIPQPLADSGDAVVQELIDRVSDHGLGCPPTADAFWVRDTRPIGGNYQASSPAETRPFAIEPGGLDLAPEELAAVSEAFGFTPMGELVAIAFCNQHEDHRVLGELSLALAERCGGVVSFDGALCPDLPLEADVDDWRQAEPHFLHMVAGMPGRILSLPYKAAEGKERVLHIADVAFLRCWLQHPQFHMVK